MSVAPTSSIDPRKLLLSGGIPAGPPIPAQRRPPDDSTGPDVTPVPVDESPAGREDWRAEVIGATWMRVP